MISPAGLAQLAGFAGFRGDFQDNCAGRCRKMQEPFSSLGK
jgi:hypothetical protein